MTRTRPKFKPAETPAQPHEAEKRDVGSAGPDPRGMQGLLSTQLSSSEGLELASQRVKVGFGGLPPLQVLHVLPQDPQAQLELANRIINHAYQQKVKRCCGAQSAAGRGPVARGTPTSSTFLAGTPLRRCTSLMKKSSGYQMPLPPRITPSKASRGAWDTSRARSPSGKQRCALQHCRPSLLSPSSSYGSCRCEPSRRSVAAQLQGRAACR